MDLRARGVPVIPHGIRLSLGGAEPLDPARVTQLAACADALDAPLVSEHIAFVRAAGREAGHLLPVPRTREALDVLAANVARLSAELTVPVALEVIAALFDWPDDELAEPEFLAAVGDRTGALLLLDVANVYANAVNRAQDPRAVLDRILDLVPADRIGYVHVAGGSARHDEAGLYHDTHTDPVPDAVLALLAHLVRARARGAGAAGARRRLPTRRSAHRRARRRSASIPPMTPEPRTASLPFQGGESPFSTRRVGISGTLAARQAALVAALVAGAPDPPGFDPARLAAARRALLRKRAGEAAKHWPAARREPRATLVGRVRRAARRPRAGRSAPRRLGRRPRPARRAHRRRRPRAARPGGPLALRRCPTTPPPSPPRRPAQARRSEVSAAVATR